MNANAPIANRKEKENADMPQPMTTESRTSRLDPFAVLELSPEASESEIRSRYLELVKVFSPEHNPDKFREIQAAYEAARDPLKLAEHLMGSSAPEEPPAWQAVIDQHARIRPAMSLNFLLSLGNRASDYRPPAKAAEDTESAQSGLSEK